MIGTPARAHGSPRLGLRAHQLDRSGRGADPGEARCLDRARERGVLGEEPVARVYGFCARAQGGLDQDVHAEVALVRRPGADPVGLVGDARVQAPAVGVGVDGDRPDPELSQRAEDPDGDLATVGHEDFGEGRHVHCVFSPKR